jgi:hypothetical protein
MVGELLVGVGSILKRLEMETDFYSFVGKIGKVLEVLTDLHVLALLIINVTKSPSHKFSSSERYTFIRRLYRLIEFFAGLITPLAKK